MSEQIALRIVRGEPTAEELAALLVALKTRTVSTADSRPTPTSRWADPRARMREPLAPGPGAWRWSAR